MTKLYLQEDEDESVEEEFEEDADPELSDDVETGIVCANCEATFEKEQGTPSLCPTCWATVSPASREEYQQANCGTLA